MTEKTVENGRKIISLSLKLAGNHICHWKARKNGDQIYRKPPFQICHQPLDLAPLHTLFPFSPLLKNQNPTFVVGFGEPNCQKKTIIVVAHALFVHSKRRKRCYMREIGPNTTGSGHPFKIS